ncbi:hypothetical protein GCM10008904_30260 [Paraclostridium ghonii]|uniref:Uncharacterized protein n=1 Tax=Paraclostridium ghonii TaxID=29358 RepID=A0ABU0MXD8_9FIRM|nr:hypothetical protein [Paeniclostridium ghonii]MDQ0555572.1 hypothetical protein [Paeniclostridium ghonii]
MINNIIKYAIPMIVYFTVLMLIIEFMRTNYRTASVIWVLSLLTFPLWIMGGVEGWFRWSKILSVILPTIVVGFCRTANVEQRKGKLWEFLQKPWILWFTYCILFLNIFEATMKDVALQNYANAGCGFLLCVTIPFAPKFWEFEKSGKGDLIAYTSFAWNFLYTTWNLCFVYGESPSYFASSVCILLAAELYPIIKGRHELYIISRVYTLATHMIVRSCFGVAILKLMDSTSWFNSNVLSTWGTINLILIIPFVFWHMWQLHTGKADKSFRKTKPSAI